MCVGEEPPALRQRLSPRAPLGGKARGIFGRVVEKLSLLMFAKGRPSLAVMAVVSETQWA